MDHSLNARLDATELTEGNLIHATLYGPNDEKIGTVSRVHRLGEETEVIVDVGGFLGVGARFTGVRAGSEAGELRVTAGSTGCR